MTKPEVSYLLVTLKRLIEDVAQPCEGVPHGRAKLESYYLYVLVDKVSRGRSQTRRIVWLR